MREVMRGDAEPAALAGFLIALRGKGETANEISGLIEAILSEAVAVPVDQDAVDIVGTGGDQAHIVNISTMAALVACGAGIPVVKHGGRAVSSKSGSADVLAALGIPWTSRPTPSHAASRRPASATCSRPASTPDCTTPHRSAAFWECPL